MDRGQPARAKVAKVNFTAARVDAHTCPAGKAQSFLWDRDAPGLGLRVTAGGAKAYIFQSKLNGTTVRVTIGSPDAWPIESQYGRVDGERRELVRGARQEARRLQTLLDRGIDPREQAAEERAAHEARQAEARRRDATVGEAWDVYLEARRSRWSERHYQDHLQHADKGGRPRKRGDGLPGRLHSFARLSCRSCRASASPRGSQAKRANGRRWPRSPIDFCAALSGGQRRPLSMVA
jgi:hypothetical protein